jgi:ketosteroid isomerase-like protein
MSLKTSDIEKMEMLLIESIRNSDLEFLEKTIHDDLLCLAPNAQTITKAMDMTAHRAGHMVVEHLTAHIEEIRIIGDTALSMVVYDTKGKMLGAPIEGKFKYLRVWKEFDDGLKVIAASCFKVV